MILLAAHRALESLTLSKQQLRLKRHIAAEYAELIYNGLWFSAHHQDLAAYVASTQRHVTGTARIRLHRGSATVTGRKAERSLYDRSLATYDREDAFDHASALGFIDIWGLQTRVQARRAAPLRDTRDTPHRDASGGTRRMTTSSSEATIVYEGPGPGAELWGGTQAKLQRGLAAPRRPARSPSSSTTPPPSSSPRPSASRTTRTSASTPPGESAEAWIRERLAAGGRLDALVFISAGTLREQPSLVDAVRDGVSA